jgi:eukaryotic-like serine/threonine-protein kinase
MPDPSAPNQPDGGLFATVPTPNKFELAQTAEVTKPQIPEFAGDLAFGEIVGGYVIESKLGSGGFGTVYRAREPSIGRLVAIKVLSTAMSQRPELLARFLDEAKAATKVRHRNIIDVFQFGQLKDGRPFQIMELLEGESLAQHLARSGPLSLEAAIPLFRAIAKALDVVHDAGIVHRDIKPDNVFLTFDDEQNCLPKLLDFGIARLNSDDGNVRKTQTGVPMGTPLYMSPEQCKGAGVGKQSDVYSFGVLVYETLTGVTPFVANTFIELMNAHINDAPAHLSHLRPTLPQELDHIVAKTLSKNPDQRPSRLTSFVNELEQAAHAAGVRVTLGESSPRIEVRRVTHLGATPNHSSELLRSNPTPKSGRSRKGMVALGLCVLATAPLAYFLVGTRTEKAHVITPDLPSPAVNIVTDPPVAPVEVEKNNENAANSVENVRLTLNTDVPQAAIYADGILVGQAGVALVRPKGETPLRFVVKAPGYEDADVSVTPFSDTAFKVPMTKLKKRNNAKPLPASLEDPYAR